MMASMACFSVCLDDDDDTVARLNTVGTNNRTKRQCSAPSSLVSTDNSDVFSATKSDYILQENIRNAPTRSQSQTIYLISQSEDVSRIGVSELSERTPRSVAMSFDARRLTSVTESLHRLTDGETDSFSLEDQVENCFHTDPCQRCSSSNLPQSLDCELESQEETLTQDTSDTNDDASHSLQTLQSSDTRAAEFLGQQRELSPHQGTQPSHNQSQEAYPYTSHVLPGHVAKDLPTYDSVVPPPSYHTVENQDQRHQSPPHAETRSSENGDLPRQLNSLTISRHVGDLSGAGEMTMRTAEQPPSVHADKSQTYSLFTAYSLCFLLGFAGFHHMYFRRPFTALLYASTFGIFGIGWLVDLMRLPWLVADLNRRIREDSTNGYILYTDKYQKLTYISLIEAFIWWLPPAGLLGGHHFALGHRKMYAAIHATTFGGFGLGWLLDLFRLPILVQRRNHEVQRFRDGEAITDNPSKDVNLEDAYILCALLGFTGAHHVYLREPCMFVLYFFTFGLCGVGWIVDLVRLPRIVERKQLELQQGTNPVHIDNTYLLFYTFGLLGFHHFYLRRFGSGIFYMLTFGFLGFVYYYDLYRLLELVKETNAKRNLTPDPNIKRRHAVAFRIPLDRDGRVLWEKRSVWLANPAQARQYRNQHGLRTEDDESRNSQVGVQPEREVAISESDPGIFFLRPEEELSSPPQPSQTEEDTDTPPPYGEHLNHERYITDTIINIEAANI